MPRFNTQLDENSRTLGKKAGNFIKRLQELYIRKKRTQEGGEMEIEWS